MLSYWARIILPFLVVCRAEAERNSILRATTPGGNERNLIVNGDDADPRDFQFFVRAGPQFSICGAALVHSDILVTAAHCQGAFNYEVLLYDSRTRDYDLSLRIAAQRRFPDYNINRFSPNYDMLVLRLTEPIQAVPPVVLNSNPNVPVPGQELTAVGFGRLEFDQPSFPDVLQEAQFIYLPQETCIQRYTVDNEITGFDFDGFDYLCVDPVGDVSVCNGDSGGPLTTDDGVLVGLTSFGVECRPDDIPDGFTRISYFYDWIQEQICEISNDPPADCPAPSPPDPNAVSLRLVFMYDFYAHEVTFAVRNLSSGAIDYAGPQYVPLLADTVESVFRLRPGLYFMEVYDAGGNGLDCPDENYPCAFFPEDGRWILLANYPDRDEEEVIASGDANFASLQLTLFEVEEFEVPSQSPSPAPSALATEAPSGSPSARPSSTPSFRPSASPKPSSIPSNKPSSTTSLRPSHSFEREDGSSAIPSDGPSSIPSDGPSSMPSYGPSFIPSDGPSTIPSDGPSTIPSDAPSYAPSMVPSVMT